jgi:hypothetical protein
MRSGFEDQERSKGGFSKTKLLIGAAGLLLFIIGLKRSHRLDNEGGGVLEDRPADAEAKHREP